MKKLLTRIGFILLLMTLSYSYGFSQNTVSGQILDADGSPVIGASVLAVGTTVGTITDIDGRYSLSVPDGATELEVSYLGYSTQTINILNGNPGLITLSEDINALDEVVITGLASSVKRSNLANAVASISAQELTGVAPQTTVDGALYGKFKGG